MRAAAPASSRSRISIATLRRLGIDATDLGVEITDRKILDSPGRMTAAFACPQVLTAWERVYRALRDAFPPERYHRRRGVRRFAQTERSRDRPLRRRRHAPRAICWSAPTAFAPPFASNACPNWSPLYAGYVAWRALIPEAAFPPAIHRELFNYMTFCLPPGEQCLGYPVAGPDDDLRPGHRRYNVVWYRPADEHRSSCGSCSPTRAASTHTISIPPPLIRREAIADMRAAAERLLAPQFREVVRMIDEPILQPIYDLETPRMAFGRVAIIGDAAFVARPHVAAGVAKAADDAAALVAALAVDDVAPALATLRGGAAAGRTAHHRACAPSRGLSAGDADRGGARPLPAPQHSRSGAGGDRGARFLAGVSAPASVAAALNAAIPRLSGALAGIANPANLPVCAPPPYVARMPLAPATR